MIKLVIELYRVGGFSNDHHDELNTYLIVVVGPYGRQPVIWLFARASFNVLVAK